MTEAPQSEEKEAEPGLRHIGYETFAVDVTKIQPGPLDRYYLISPGDKLVLRIWGQLQLTYLLTVSNDSYVEIPEVPGRLYVSGLTLSQLEQRVRQHLATVYASYFSAEQPNSPAAFVDLTLAEVRDIQFLVMGNVDKPGSYSLHPSRSNLLYALASAGGVNESGSLRQITIRRGPDLFTFDFYRLLLMGEPEFQQWQVMNNDIIFVPQKRAEVSVDGEIKRPGIYELVDTAKEDLETFLNLAGGLKPTASEEKLLIRRVNINVGQETLDVNLLEKRRNGAKVYLQDQDHITVFGTQQDRMDYVLVEGKGVQRPGEAEFKHGMRISDLIRGAGGLRLDAYMERADLVRTRPDKLKVYMQVNLEQVMKMEEAQNVLLQPMDKLIIYSVQDIEGGQKYLTLRGHVKHPGRYEFYRGMRLYDLLFTKGGFQDRDFLHETYLERADLIRASGGGLREELIKFNLGKLLEGDTVLNLPLQSDDELIVYSVKEIVGGDRFVTLSGHARKLGQHRLFEGMRLFDLLYTAGGYQDPDFRLQAFLRRGDIKRLVNRGTDRVEREVISFNLGAVLDGDPLQNLELRSGDEVRLYAAKEFQEQRFVTIEGLVLKPGRYELLANMTLDDLLVQAGGITASAYQTRADIARLNLNGNPEVKQELITVEIPNDYLSHGSQGSIQLQSDDIVFVRRRPGVVGQQVVEIQGEVALPGKYPLTPDKQRLSDLVTLAGGLNWETAFPIGATLTRKGEGRVFLDFEKALSKRDSPDNLALRHGDVIVIPKKPNTVKISGEVFHPVVVPYKEGEGVGYYIKQAGGSTKAADNSRTEVIHPNGMAIRAKGGFLFFGGSVRILPGSTIVVPSSSAKVSLAAPSSAVPAPAPSVVPPQSTPLPTFASPAPKEPPAEPLKSPPPTHSKPPADR